MTVQKTCKQVTLPMWRGYRAGRSKPCTGVLEVEHHGRKTPMQLAALNRTVANAAKMKPAILKAIVEAWSTFRKWSPRPKTVTVAALKKLIAPWQLVLTTDHHEGMGYVIYDFEASWDPSGINVIVHGDRVTAAGDWEILGYPIRDPARTPPAPRAATPAKIKAIMARAHERAAKNPKSLPSNALEGEVWIHLPAWAGTSTGDGDIATGEIGVDVGGDAMGEGEIGAPQKAAYRAIASKTKSKAMKDVVLGAIAEPKWWKALTRGTKMPKTVTPEVLRNLVTLVMVHIHWTNKDGLAYVGYELSCTWDREHGVGVMTHGERVVTVGGADMAILGWVAERDAKRATLVM